MLYPVELEITNIGPYRGTHTIDLVDDVYAVTAKRADNPERSNWVGKSTMLWCMPYALFGEHPAKTDNDWITTGEAWSEVKFVLSDGSCIRRRKTFDKSTHLSFVRPGQAELLQSAAQDAIERHIGLSKDEFMTVCFYAQKELSRLVSARSAERIEIVESWIAAELDPVQRMHSRALVDMQKVMTAIEALKTELFNLRGQADALVVRHGWNAGTNVPATLEMMITQVRADAKVAATVLESTRKNRLSAETWSAKVEIAAEFDALNEEGQRLRAELDGIPADIDEQLAAKRTEELQAVGESELSRAELKRAKAALGGAFNGICPVNCKSCPKPAWVKQNPLDAALLKALEQTDTDAAQRLLGLQRETLALLGRYRRRVELTGKLQVLREQAIALVDTANEVASATHQPDIDALDDSIASAETMLSEANTNLNTLVQEKAFFDNAVTRLNAIMHEEAVLLKRRVVITEALQLLGKTGIQQKLGEIALANVEVGANAMLASTGIPLAVSVLWAVQNQGLAKVCDKCGTAYGTSAKVKTCARCGNARGPNSTAKLVIDLTNRSGAAEDLAGIAVGLSASAWLRAKRGSNWGSVCIDEPFGALDQHNKKALSVHVATLLKNSFASAFIVAHDREILDALPQRITIVGTDQGSSFEAI